MDDQTFKVRLNCFDHYQAPPNDDFDPPVPRAAAGKNRKDRPRVSVIRVFGATETGQRVLAHVHGAFQYTYIEYSGSLIPEDVEVAIRTLQLSIDHALAVSYRKNIYEGTHSYVAHISLVKGIPFYGYHVGYKFYLKIYLLNPLHMTRLADLLRVGAVMKRVLQPYESHMQYLAQWMCDYNLYGCAYIECRKVKFRAPVPDWLDLDNELHSWHDRSIPPELISDELPKQSHCSLEVDVCVQDILNRQNVEARNIHHDFVERIQPLPADVKLVQSMAGLWKDETRRRKNRMGLNDPNSSPFPPEVLITMSADARSLSAGVWIHEQEYREKIAQIAKDEHDKANGTTLSFDTFVKPVAGERNIQTALESVADLFPENFAALLAHETSEDKKREVDALASTQAIIDETRIRQVANIPGHAVNEASIDREMVPQQVSTTAVNGKTTHGNGNSSPPISSSEYENLGIRRNGNFEDLENDAFEVPEGYLTKAADAEQALGKRSRTTISTAIKSRKRRMMLVDDPLYTSDHASEDEVDEEPDHVCLNGTMSSNLSSANKSHELNGRQPSAAPDKNAMQIDDLNSEQFALTDVKQKVQKMVSFPVVKDPQDPSTILRLSQQSSSPVKPQTEASHSISKATGKLTHPSQSPTTATHTTTKSVETLSRGSRLAHQLQVKGLFTNRACNRIDVYQVRPPSKTETTRLSAGEEWPDVIYRDAYYSKGEDVPERPREYGGREFKLESTTVPYLPDFDSSGSEPALIGQRPQVQLDKAAEEATDRRQRRLCKVKLWTILDAPPSKSEVERWLTEHREKSRGAHHASTVAAPAQSLSQVDGPTQKNKFGFKFSQKDESTSVKHEIQYMSIMSLEVHVNTRGSLAPNPEKDEIACVFWCVQNDDAEAGQVDSNNTLSGVLVLASEPTTAGRIAGCTTHEVAEEATEVDLLTRLVDIVRYYDPDILTGYEVHNSSWGYLIERARLKYEMNLCDELSRMKAQSHGRFGKDDDRWGFNHTSTIRVTGRHTINIWRAMRGEVNLLQYTMENVTLHLLHKRIPHYTFADLTTWYKSKAPRDLAKVINYFASRVRIDLQILDANELVPRTSEQARLLGVDWFSVISRGSQFKVESLMFRIAKPENFILASPSRRQVGGQNALECLPLVMEPQSDFYPSPLLVLDFQSLYPSVMIAYNYCYSTFLGRIVNWRGTNKMGFSNYQREERLIELLKDHINIAPNGIMYAKTHIRKSLLAKMLSEILETRVMVKSGMKVDKDDKTLQQLLNNRQLALKLIANVTYGYTSASFSGRMPCSEIADSIVQTGRETLEKTIALIHSIKRWGAEVVYGDTDSIFVYLRGRTRAEAFEIGEDIAATVTKMNPRPVKLKFEKVYHPCVLLAKKRYVGFKYEHRNQTEPDFDAKGIETVRRDGTPAEQKIEETALKILFRTADLSQVKSFFQAQCSKIMKGKVSIQDFCFAREVKLGTYSDKGPPPPGALISARRMVEDPRLEPQYGERVPYLVITGGPGARLIDRCVAPEVLLNDAQLELDAEYYISKNLIPPLERIFNLVGANVRQWYDEMPKYQRIRRVEVSMTADGMESGLSKKTLESYMKSSTCLVCREALDSESPICNNCFENAPQSMLHLQAKLSRAEKKTADMAKICRSCSGLAFAEEVCCDSKDCPVFYSRTRLKSAFANSRAQILPVLKVLQGQEDAEIEW